MNGVPDRLGILQFKINTPMGMRIKKDIFVIEFHVNGNNFDAIITNMK